MSISAKVVADSKNEFGNRITTMVVTFPRIILAEFNTHRMFSRNSASSRAIPFEKMVNTIKNNPFVPIAWQKDHKGMQGTEYFPKEWINNNLLEKWYEARDRAVWQAELLSNVGVTKQIVNRLLEPFMWHTVIVTATEWENFFALRCPQYTNITSTNEKEYKPKVYRSWRDFVSKASLGNLKRENLEKCTIIDKLKINRGQAEIHMMALAEAMWDAYNESIPKELKAGEWHIPFGDNIKFDLDGLPPQNLIDNFKVKIATARCARVSYTVVGEEDKLINYDNDIKLHDKLLASGHMSPFEHCAQAIPINDSLAPDFYESGNFKGGWRQYRKTIAGENKTV